MKEREKKEWDKEWKKNHYHYQCHPMTTIELAYLKMNAFVL